MTKHRNRTVQRRPDPLMGEKTEQSRTDYNEENSPSPSMVVGERTEADKTDCEGSKKE